VRRAYLKEKQLQSNFGKAIGIKDKNKHKIMIFDRLSYLARRNADKKRTDVKRSKWSVEGEEWKLFPINLQPLKHRAESFQIRADVYRYHSAPEGSLIIDFANKHVGGGWLGYGFVQEEQMLAQSTDFAISLKSRPTWLWPNEVATYEGVHMDVWWSREEAHKKLGMSLEAILPELSKQLVIVAADAPNFKGTSGGYDAHSLNMLAKKLYLCFAILYELNCPQMFTGLIGGGDFQGNRPLVLLLHLLLHTEDRPVLFHNPIFCKDSHYLESKVAIRAEQMLDRLRMKGVRTLGEALQEILQWRVPLSRHDADLR